MKIKNNGSNGPKKKLRPKYNETSKCDERNFSYRDL